MLYYEHWKTKRQIRMIGITHREIKEDRVQACVDGDHVIGCLPSKPGAFPVHKDLILHKSEPS